MWTHKKKADDASLDMTPLVDMVFLLIIFFMLSTTFIIAPGIRLDLPRAAAEKVQLENKELVLSIDKNGVFYLDHDRIEDQTLQRMLEEAARDDRRLLALVRGDRQSNFGRIVELLAMIRKAGLSRIAIVTERTAPSLEEGSPEGD